ncbi:VOC family protein [Jatrophihabitans sp. DSM 45814]
MAAFVVPAEYYFATASSIYGRYMMVTRDTPWPAGTPCWVDVSAADISAARLFYEGLFGWQVVEGPPEFGGYSTATKGGHAVAGLAPVMSEDQPVAWTTYLAVENADATAAAISENGGQVLAPPMDVADLGRMAIAVDPGGAAFGIWQAGTHTGVQLANEPGSLIWEENMTGSWEANQKFYAAVFGFSFADVSDGEFKYATFAVDGASAEAAPIGGVGEAAADDDSGPAWLIYFAVDDTDESADEVVKLGGNVIRPAWDTPFGRMAVVSDPGGARFALISTPGEEATN